MASYSINYDIEVNTSGFKQSLNELSSKTKSFFSSLKEGMGDFTTGMNSMASKFRSFSREGSSSFKELSSGISDTAELLSPSGALASGIMDIIGLLQKLGDEFDNLRAKMVQLTGTDGIIGLENSLKDVLGTGVAQNANVVAETLAVVYKSFDLTGDSLEALSKKFLDFSHVTGADLPDSVEKVSEAIKKWGLSTNDASRVLEQLTYASQHSNATIKELLTGLTNGQAVLSQFGMSMSESVAFLAKLSDSGIKVNTTLWGMRQALSEFSKNGINAGEGLRQVTEQIQNAKTQTEALNIAVDVFGTKAGAELVQVLKKGGDEISSFTTELINVQDVIKSDEEEMETLGVMLNKMVNSIKSTFSSLGQGVNSIVKLLVDSFMDLVEVLSLLKPLFDALRVAIEMIIYPIKKVMESLREVVGWFKDFTSAERDNKVATEEATRAYENEQRILENLRTTVKGMTQEAREARIEWLKRNLTVTQGLIDDVQSQIDQQKEILDKYGSIIGLDNNGMLTSLGVSELFGTEEFEKAGEAWENAKSSIEKLESELTHLQGIYDSLGKELKVYQDIVEETAASDANAVADFVASIGKVTSNWHEKILRQKIQMLQDEQKNEITRLQNEGATDEEILKTRNNYNDKIKQANLDLINYLNERDKEEFINKVANAEKVTVEVARKLVEDKENHKAYYDAVKEMDDYYENERIRNATDAVDRIKSINEKLPDVNTKYQKMLREQALRTAQIEMQNAVTRLENENATDEEILKTKEQYSRKILNIMRKQNEISRQEALQGVTDAEEIARINMYWDNEQANLKIENVERIIQAKEKEKAVNYSWDIRLLELDKEEAVRDKEKLAIEEQILIYQRDMALATADVADHDKIREYYDRKIKALYEVQDKALEEINEEQDKLIEKTKTNYSWTQKIMSQTEKELQLKMDVAVKEAELTGASEEEIFKIKERYLKEIQIEQEKQLELERDIYLERLEDDENYADESLKIDTWYNNEKYLLAMETQAKIDALRPKKRVDDDSKAVEINAREDALEAIYNLTQTWQDKTTASRISQLEYLRSVEMDIAEQNGWTQEQIYERQAEYIDKITELKKQQLYKERDEAINNAYDIMKKSLEVEGLTTAEKEQMADDYNKAVLTIRRYYLDQENELDLKALKDKESYRDKDLKEEESFWNKVVAYVSDSMSKIAGFISQTFGNNGIVKGMLGVFESVKGIVSSAFTMLKDIGKSLYKGFEKIFPEVKEAFQETMGNIWETMGNIWNEIKNFFSNMPEWLKDVGKQLVKAFSVIGGHLVNVAKATVKMIIAVFQVMGGALDIYKKAWEGFVKVLDFDPEEALIGLLEFEDKILTFFMFTLPKLPAYFASSIESIGVLLETLFNTVDFGLLSESLADAFGKGFQMIPNIIRKAMPSLLKALKGLVKGLTKVLPDILKAGLELVKALFAELPRFVSQQLPELISQIVKFIPDLFKSGSQLVLSIVNMLPTLLQNVIDAFIALLQDRATLNQLVMGIVRGITEMVTVIINNIVPIVKALIPAVVEIIINLIKELPNMVGQILAAIGNALWDFLRELFTGGLSGGGGGSSGGKRDWGASRWEDGYDVGDITGTIVDATVDSISWLWDNTLGRLFADGTNDAQRGLAIVGEAGPELVRFNGGEQVINNRNTQKLLGDMGKGNVTINNAFYNTADTTAYQLMRQLNQQRRELAFNCIL